MYVLGQFATTAMASDGQVQLVYVGTLCRIGQFAITGLTDGQVQLVYRHTVHIISL